MPRVITAHHPSGVVTCATALTYTGEGVCPEAGDSTPASLHGAISSDASGFYVVGPNRNDGADGWPQLHVWDVSGVNPSWVKKIDLKYSGLNPGPLNWADLGYKGDRVYAFCKTSSVLSPWMLSIVDISTPLAPTYVDGLDSDGSWSGVGPIVADIGGSRYLFTNHLPSGISVIDVTGDTPSLVANFGGNPTFSHVDGGDSVGDYLYCPHWDDDTNNGETWAEIWDISDPTAATLAATTPVVSPPAWWDGAEDTNAASLCRVIGNVLLLGSWWYDTSGALYANKMDAFNISNLAAITHIDQVDTYISPSYEGYGAGKWGTAVIRSVYSGAQGYLIPYCIPQYSLTRGTAVDFTAGSEFTLYGAQMGVAQNTLAVAGYRHVLGVHTQVVRRYTVAAS